MPGNEHYYGEGLLLNINEPVLRHWPRTLQRQHERTTSLGIEG